MVLLLIILSGAVIVVVVYVIIRKYQRQTRKSLTDETALQVPNVYSTTSPSDALTNLREVKVLLILRKVD